VNGTNLVAANLLSNKVQGLNDAKTKLLTLLILCDGDILNVTNLTQAVNAIVVMSVPQSSYSWFRSFLQDSQLPLNDQGTSAHNLVLAIKNDQNVIASCTFTRCLHLFKTLCEILF
jgi:hypothetical protein